MEICQYLKKKDLQNLRFVCRFFYEKILIYPTWKQLIPFEKLKDLQVLHQIHLDQHFIYGIYFSDFHPTSPSSFSVLPKTLKYLDLRKCWEYLTDAYFESLPPSLTRLTLPWSSFSVTGEGLSKLVEKHRRLDIEFVEWKGTFSLLYWACLHGHLMIVEKLFQNQRDLTIGRINEQYGVFKETALYVSCQEGHTEIVDILLKNGALSSSGRGYYDTKTPLYIASCRGHKEIVELLLKHQANVNVGYHDIGYTPLMIASSLGRIEIVKSLLNYGATVSLKDKYGKTALDIAYKNGRNERITDLLINAFTHENF